MTRIATLREGNYSVWRQKSGYDFEYFILDRQNREHGRLKAEWFNNNYVLSYYQKKDNKFITFRVRESYSFNTMQRDIIDKASELLEERLQ